MITAILLPQGIILLMLIMHLIHAIGFQPRLSVIPGRMGGSRTFVSGPPPGILTCTHPLNAPPHPPIKGSLMYGSHPTPSIPDFPSFGARSQC